MATLKYKIDNNWIDDNERVESIVKNMTAIENITGRIKLYMDKTSSTSIPEAYRIGSLIILQMHFTLSQNVPPNDSIGFTFGNYENIVGWSIIGTGSGSGFDCSFINSWNEADGRWAGWLHNCQTITRSAGSTHDVVFIGMINRGKPS